MTSPLEKVRRLIHLAMSESYNEHEARTAAMAAVRLINEHHLLKDDCESTSTTMSMQEMTDIILETFIETLCSGDSWTIGVSELCNVVLTGLDLAPDSVTRRRVYHRVRYRLEQWSSQGLLKRKPSVGYALVPGATLRDFGFKST